MCHLHFYIYIVLVLQNLIKIFNNFITGGLEMTRADVKR